MGKHKQVGCHLCQHVEGVGGSEHAPAPRVQQPRAQQRGGLRPRLPGVRAPRAGAHEALARLQVGPPGPGRVYRPYISEDNIIE